MFKYSLAGNDGSGSGFGSWKTVPAVPVLLSVSGKTVPTVPVSGSGSVPEPPGISNLRSLVGSKSHSWGYHRFSSYTHSYMFSALIPNKISYTDTFDF